MNLRWLKKLITQVGSDGQPALIIFHLAVVAGGFGVAATFGYIAEVASSNGYLLHAAAHSLVAAFGTATTAAILWQSLIGGRK